MKFVFLALMLTVFSKVRIFKSKNRPRIKTKINGEVIKKILFHKHPKAVPTAVPAVPEVPDPTAGVNEQSDLGCLASHNKYRVESGVPALVWSEELAKKATDWANNLDQSDSFKHSGSQGVGENLAKGYKDCDAAVSAWYNEKPLFKSGVVDSEFHAYGHYTQLVWKNTKTIGCGKSGNVIVCQYQPPGNFMGQAPF